MVLASAIDPWYWASGIYTHEKVYIDISIILLDMLRFILYWASMACGVTSSLGGN